jgi:hypothetical protein
MGMGLKLPTMQRALTDRFGRRRVADGVTSETWGVAMWLTVRPGVGPRRPFHFPMNSAVSRTYGTARISASRPHQGREWRILEVPGVGTDLAILGPVTTLEELPLVPSRFAYSLTPYFLRLLARSHPFLALT